MRLEVLTQRMGSEILEKHFLAPNALDSAAG